METPMLTTVRIVRRRFRHVLRADQAARARPVLDDHLLPEALAQALS